MAFELRTLAVMALVVGACSDDGVPANETTVGDGTADTGSASASATDPTTQTTSATDTSPSTTAASTGDPTDAESSSGTPGDADSTSAGPQDTTSSTADTSSSDATGDSSSSSGTGNDGAPLGDPCKADADCASGVCWDFSDYDPLCGGTACSGECMTDDDCVQLILDGGGDYPDASYCGEDGRCSMVGTGFGSYVCAGA